MITNLQGFFDCLMSSFKSCCNLLPSVLQLEVHQHPYTPRRRLPCSSLPSVRDASYRGRGIFVAETYITVTTVVKASALTPTEQSACWKPAARSLYSRPISRILTCILTHLQTSDSAPCRRRGFQRRKGRSQGCESPLYGRMLFRARDRL